MTLQPGTRLGPYEIGAAIGAGGMGEVYRARDTRLDRDVAIKVLPSHLAADPQLGQRFEREARAVSSLNHPHICTLHDVGNDGGVHFLVMELLDGETLAQRLEKGALPVDDVLTYASQIADALDKAHRRGLVHRDLKPGNIMLTPDGAKLLDFGLAKTVDAAGPAASHLATVAGPLTTEGSIVGTFQYMSPEQLEGSEADARSDIFSFGAVVYEMLTGRRAFAGKSQTGLLVAVMEHDPAPISTRAPLVPPALDRLVQRCLAKDPDERWQTMSDLASELKWIDSAGSQAGVATPVLSRRRSRQRAWMVATAVLALSTIALASRSFLVTVPPPRVTRAFLLAPAETKFRSVGGSAAPPTLSPDGRHVVFGTRSADGQNLLWVRSLDQLQARPLPGTRSGTRPFWSPDSRFIGFFGAGKLKKIDVNGGPALTLADAPDGRGGSWNRAGDILFSPTYRSSVWRVPAAGGEAVEVTHIDQARNEETHRYPFFLPDGQHFLYLVRVRGKGRGEQTAVQVGDLDSGTSRLLFHVDSNVAYASGRLFYVRERTLIAQGFDARKLAFTGDPMPIADDVQFDRAYSQGVFSISSAGVLVYQTGRGQTLTQMALFDADGRKVRDVGEAGHYPDVALSRDGSMAAMTVVDPISANWDIWLLDLTRGVKTRHTFDAAIDCCAAWSPDGRFVVFSSDRGGKFDLYRKDADGSGTEQLIRSSEGDSFSPDISADGRWILFTESDATGLARNDLWAVSLEDAGKPEKLVATEFNENWGVFSPDGKWFAYTSDESGREEVYIAPFPGPGGKWQVTAGGGTQPRWNTDQTSLYFVALDGAVSVAPVTLTGARVQVGQVRRLFDADLAVSPFRNYDVVRDGSRWVINTPLEADSETPLTLVLNWAAVLPPD